MIKADKYRHEFKYLISDEQMAVLKIRTAGILKVDPHTVNGIYNIRSVYFDDYYDRCFYENENGTDPREKFRIRIYNHQADRISLECKRKQAGKTLKTSCILTKEQADMLIHGEPVKIDNNSPQVLKKLVKCMITSKMKPKIIVEYDRVPYICKQGNVRITLDTNISSSRYVEKFFDDIIPKRPVLPLGMQLLEVKYDEFLPDYIYKSLEIENLRQTAFSKYYLCRKYSN